MLNRNAKMKQYFQILLLLKILQTRLTPAPREPHEPFHKNNPYRHFWQSQRYGLCSSSSLPCSCLLWNFKSSLLWKFHQTSIIPRQLRLILVLKFFIIFLLLCLKRFCCKFKSPKNFKHVVDHLRVYHSKQ